MITLSYHKVEAMTHVYGPTINTRRHMYYTCTHSHTLGNILLKYIKYMCLYMHK